MKICVMTSTYALSEQDCNVPFLVQSVRRLKARGHEVYVFAPSYEGCPNQVVHGVPVRRFRYFFRRWENLTHKQGAPNRIRNPIYLGVAFFYILFGLFQAIRYCRRHRFDIIHVQWPFPHGIWGSAASRLSGAPMVLTFHGAELLLCRKYFFVKYFLKHAIKNAGVVHCNSSFTAGEIGRLSNKPVEIVPYGCTVHARPVTKDLDKPVKDILFVGRLISRKGVDYLIRAVPRLAEKMPVRVHIVGHGDKGNLWKALCRELGVEDKVIFHGAVSAEELEQQYANADVFVLPAIVDERGDTEGLGVVLVEALCFQTPVVASAVGGIPDVIIDGQTGMLVPERDPVALAEAVIKLVQDRTLARHLTQGGLAHANEYFDWDRIIDQHVHSYQKCWHAWSMGTKWKWNRGSATAAQAPYGGKVADRGRWRRVLRSQTVRHDFHLNPSESSNCSTE
jgi:glycosyltransferase involved in cell wall biosynthesis